MFKIFFWSDKIFLFAVVSKSESITPAKFQLDRIKTVRYASTHTHLAPAWGYPPKITKNFFSSDQKNFCFWF